MRNNKVLPVVPATVKKYLNSFFDGEPAGYLGGQFILSLVRDYLLDPDKYCVKPSVINRMMKEKETAILTISFNDKDYALFEECAALEMRSLVKQGTWILLSIAASFKQMKIKKITVQNNTVTFKIR